MGQTDIVLGNEEQEALEQALGYIKKIKSITIVKDWKLSGLLFRLFVNSWGGIC